MKIQEVFSHIFNWKKNPASVFYFAIPLASIGLLCPLAVALIRGIKDHDWVYMGIYVVFISFGIFVLYKPVKYLIKHR